MRFARLIAATAGCAAVAATSGCSGTRITGGIEAGKDAASIFKDGIAAMHGAKSVHVKGPISGLLFDADLGGGDFNGTVDQGGNVFSIVYIADPGRDPSRDLIYLRAPATAWTAVASAAIASCVDDRWLIIDPLAGGSRATSPTGAAQLTSDAGQLGNLAALADAIGASPGTLTKGANTTVNGAQAIEIKSSSGSSVFISADVPAYPLRISATANGSTRSIDFTNWNGGAAFNAPPGAQPLATLLASCPGASAAASPTPSPTP